MTANVCFNERVMSNEAIDCHEWATESLTHLFVQNLDSFSNETPLCVARRRNSSAVALIATIFVSEIEQKQSIFCLKSMSLNFNLLFIEILLYKISVTLQSC